MDFNLIEMLSLRYDGTPVVALAARYSKHHTTITHHCLKHGVAPGAIGKLADMDFVAQMHEQFEFRKTWPVTRVIRRGPLPRVKPERKRLDKYEDIFDEPINQGKRSYRDYLAEAKDRPIEKHYHQFLRTGSPKAAPGG